MTDISRAPVWCCLALLACGPAPAEQPSGAAEYLYLWTASADSSQPDFLAVLDVTETSGRYGRLVTTVPVPGLQNMPHHTEHQMPADRRLFANGFATGQTFVFDLKDPLHPRVAARFGDVEGFTHPHSFLRLPGGHVLATFQMRHDGGAMAPGGLVELTADGRPVRSRSANTPGIDPATRVYSAGVVPALDRIVTTTTDMHGRSPASRQLQIWRLSDLTLLHTITLPDGPAGEESMMTAEPRVLDDGRTVLVSTFSCGLYLMQGLEGESPQGRLVASFPRKPKTYCAIPVVAGHYYLVTVPAWSAVVSLDISDPAAPREVSRVTLGPDDVPHWISMSEDRRRVVVTGYREMKHRVLIARFDSATGRLSLDDRFREPGASAPGFRMDDKTWPHGGNAKGIPHGSVFGRP
jgi:56kDa selenium binding protein (SBP56)